MEYWRITYIIAVCSLAFANCGSGAGGDIPVGPGPGPSTDNSLKKTLSVSLSNQDTYLSLGSITLARNSATSSYLYWIAPVTNTRTTAISFVELDTIYFRDNSSSVVDNEPLEFVTGSVMKESASGTFTNTCLQSGETGYVFGILLDNGNNLYARLSSVTIRTISYSTATMEFPNADITGTTFSTNGTVLSATVANSGTATARLNVIIPAIALIRDNLKAPLMWTYLDTTTTSVLEPNASCTLADLYFTYPGQIDKLLVFPDYEDMSTVIAHGTAKTRAIKLERRAFASEEAFLYAFIAHRNSLETAKRVHL
jgi:hypothetical protein